MPLRLQRTVRREAEDRIHRQGIAISLGVSPPPRVADRGIDDRSVSSASPQHAPAQGVTASPRQTRAVQRSPPPRSPPPLSSRREVVSLSPSTHVAPMSATLRRHMLSDDRSTSFRGSSSNACTTQSMFNDSTRAENPIMSKTANDTSSIPRAKVKARHLTSSSSAQPSSCAPVSLRGVSVQHLAAAFLEEVNAVGLSRDATIYEIEPSVIRPKGAAVRCPADGRLGASYVNALHGEDCAGPSTWMLSYSWGYAIGDIADTLLQYCRDLRTELKATYVWMCCLCINQHRVKERESQGKVVSFAEFEKAFGDRVSRIGHVVAMMAPWQKPVYVTRVWCCYEMFSAASLRSACRTTIVMPPREAENLRRSLLEKDGLDQVWQTLSDLNVEKAQASIEEDRTRILEMISRGPGYEEFNNIITKHLKTWIVQSCEEYLKQELNAFQGMRASLQQQLRRGKRILELCTEVGRLLAEVGCPARARDILQQAKRIHQLAGTMETVEYANLLFRLGIMAAQCGDIDLATASYKEALQIRDQLEDVEGLGGAKLFQAIGHARMQCEDFDGASEAFAMSKKFFEDLNALRTSDGAKLITSIGAVQSHCDDLEQADATFAEARSIFNETGTLETPDAAQLLMQIGILHMKQNNINEAFALFSDAQRIRHLTGTLNTLDGAMLLMNIGRTKQLNGDTSGALKMWEESRGIHEQLGTMGTCEAAQVFVFIGDLLQGRRDWASGLDAYLQALQVFQRVEAPVSRAPLIAKIRAALSKADAADIDFAVCTRIRQTCEAFGIMDL